MTNILHSEDCNDSREDFVFQDVPQAQMVEIPYFQGCSDCHHRFGEGISGFHWDDNQWGHVSA